MNNDDYLFDNPHTIARYIYYLKNQVNEAVLSPIKLQKSLYFLFAYYSAMYGEPDEDNVFEGSDVFPKYLFNGRFEAWKYGPVIRDVYQNDKYDEQEYYSKESVNTAVEEVKENEEIKKFIDDLFGQIDQVSDFSLVERSHQDEAWSDSYQEGLSTEIDHEEIIKEYKDRYVN